MANRLINLVGNILHWIAGGSLGACKLLRISLQYSRHELRLLKEIPIDVTGKTLNFNTDRSIVSACLLNTVSLDIHTVNLKKKKFSKRSLMYVLGKEWRCNYDWNVVQFTAWLLHTVSCHLSPLLSTNHSLTHSLTHKPSLSYNADPLSTSQHSALQKACLQLLQQEPRGIPPGRPCCWMLTDTPVQIRVIFIQDCHRYVTERSNYCWQNSMKTMMAVLSPDPPWRGTFNHLVFCLQHVTWLWSPVA